MSEARIVAGAAEPEDRLDGGLRPRKLDDFVGQRAVRENLRIFIAAAAERGEALDHVLFYGPPASARRRSRRSSPASSASASARLRAPSSRAPAIWRQF